MEGLHKTVLNDHHVRLGANMVEFGGWEMPLHYETGIVQEHLSTRRGAGLFDISHMGRFTVRGRNALGFLQHVLTNNAAALEEEEAQYTMIPDEGGGIIDDAYLYRFVADEYIMVVNASNREKDFAHLAALRKQFGQVELTDRTDDLAMLSLQGPTAKDIMLDLISGGRLPEPMRNCLSAARINGRAVLISRTGYTGEPICFELFIARTDAPDIWEALITTGAQPVGLGARDTLRLEAGLPLYGHELGLDPEGREIPAYASMLARFSVSLSPLKGDFIGRAALTRQHEAFKRIIDRDFSLIADLPRIIQPIALTEKGIARAEAKVFNGDRHVGYVTSGTMVPLWQSEGAGLSTRQSDDKGQRAIGLALLDSDLAEGDEVEVEIRSKRTPAVIVPYHMRAEAPPHCWPIFHDQLCADRQAACTPGNMQQSAKTLIRKAIDNHTWRQRQCVNLIPSEQSASPLAHMLSVTDPAGRYAEHKQVKAFKEADVFYYQGTDFIAEVEDLLTCEFQRFLACSEVEARVISGQMANMAVFSALVDHLNRADRKGEQRRIRKVMNHHIIKGGHLSAQPMGALRDFVMRDPTWEKPAVVNFPVLEDNPYKIDVDAARELIAKHRPELMILGKSVILHKEPVQEMRAIVDDLELDCVLMYDMAHVLGLVGTHFQKPFEEGADVVTGSTHKTFFGTQRGIAAANYADDDPEYEFWEAIQRRAFPGSTSNHHLGTLLGLLIAAYEMNAFKDEYQRNVVANAKAFAVALKDCGLDVAGDPAISFTETHQVIINVGYARAPDIARRLEDNHIILNYQAAPDEESFSASGSLRTGVQEMTRFGMRAADCEELAQLMADVIRKNRNVKQDVMDFRQRFVDMRYCFAGDEFDALEQRLHEII